MYPKCGNTEFPKGLSNDYFLIQFYRYLFLQGLSNEHRCIWEFTFSLFISLIYDLLLRALWRCRCLE
ncbi:hypothetical protein Hanom_Chr00s000004g01608101 [Helianthus anomalus]